MRRFIFFFIFILLFLGMTHPVFTQSDSEQEVQSVVRDKIGDFKGSDLLKGQDDEALLKNRVNLKQVLWIALCFNPDLKAKLAEVQVALADMQEMGLVESPQLEVDTRFPVSSPRSKTSVDLKLSQNLMSLIQLPTRKKIAQQEYESRRLEVAHEIVALLTGVKKAYYHHQAALHLRDFWKMNLLAARSITDLAKGQKKAGNISLLEESRFLSLANMAQLELSKIENEVVKSRLELAKRMGTQKLHASLKIPVKLPKLPNKDPDLADLEILALENRSDLISQKQKLLARQYSLKLVREKWLPNLNVGVGATLDAEGSNGLGPVIQMGLPLLGHRKIGIKKAEAELNQSQKSVQALEQNIPSDLEETYQQLVFARKTIQLYQKQILPTHSQIVNESLKNYNYMLLGNYELLQVKQGQINAQRELIEALRDYWIAYSDLEFLAGGSLDSTKKDQEKR